MKRTLRALSVGAVALSSSFLVSAPAEARIQIDALGGEVEINGYLSSEARARVGGGESYLNQWIQRLQIEASANYEDVGVFDSLAFVTVVRPEFDAAYYYGDSIGYGTARNAGSPSYLGTRFTGDSYPVGFNGFGAGLSTGGINKLVTNGLQDPNWINDNFEVILNRTANGQAQFSGAASAAGPGFSGFPLMSATSQMELNCKRCLNLDNDPLDVAMNNTDSNENIYPFRELYADATVGDWWFRVGKQQIVWGKTDFFRLQDIINPVDFGQHFFFDSFEDIRIPQWIASAQWKFGDWGPTTDNAIQFVWNFDEFDPVGLGNPSQGWAHPFAKQKSTFAIFNTFFSVDPCVGVNAGGTPGQTCGSRGPNDPRLPSGFGVPLGLSEEMRPEWELGNTEGGLRWEFRLGELHLALSAYSGFNDIPVFRFHSVNVPVDLLAAGDVPAATCESLGTCNGVWNGQAYTDALNVGLLENIALPVAVMDPQQALQAIAANGNAVAQQAIATGNASLFYTTGAILGGQTDIQYQRNNTLGLSFDYFESFTGTVFRVESSVTIDELVNNTWKANWVDESDVMRWSVGIDRPTWIKWLNKDRTFFLSTQLFDTWYLDHEGDKHSGFYTDEHNFIWTFFFIGNYMRDRVTPLGFLVWEEASNSWVAGFNTEWKMDNHWSVKGGLHTIWGGNENWRHDSGPFSSFIQGIGGTDPYQQAVFGVAREGIGALRANDELFLQLKYQF